MSFPKINPTKTNAWQALTKHTERLKHVSIIELFNQPKNRAQQMSICLDDNLLFDYSKNKLDTASLLDLLKLADETALKDAIEAMFCGETINETEGRAVLHTALRQQSKNPLFVGGADIIPLIEKENNRIAAFANKVHQQQLKGHTGKTIDTIVNIGIGGSDLGPVMVSEALKPFHNQAIKAFFVSNVDGAHMHETLKLINPETTLFIIASKTFTTQETMANANTARKWFLQYLPEEAISLHFVALSTNLEAVAAFGINQNQTFGFWDWVGGRYSVWSAIGMPVACLIGYDLFSEFLRGASVVDNHLRHTPFAENIPVLMALIGIWNTNFLGASTEAVLPYDQYLHRFSAYLQQANMESNGKRIDRNGEVITYRTGPIVWGEPGTNGQHAFYQLIHQGTHLIPCDFIASANANHPYNDHQELLLANFFAQTRALMVGKDAETVANELANKGFDNATIEKLLPHKIFPGNIPTNSLLIKNLNPYTLGQLIALYEHKIFVQGVIWNVFSFDQWGVELGKQLANEVLPAIKEKTEVEKFDDSTNLLINKFKAWKKPYN